MSTLLKVGASVLNYSANYILEHFANNDKVTKSDVNKIGVAAPVENQINEEKVSPEELLKKQQVLFTCSSHYVSYNVLRCLIMYQS